MYWRCGAGGAETLLLKLVVKGEEFPKKLASMWFTEEDVDAEE
jgi:hypothetical protein